MATFFFGICGRANPRPCKLSWASSFPNEVGTYPADLLPAKSTVWFAQSLAIFTFGQPLVTGGVTFGVGGFLGGFAPFAPQLPEFHIGQSHYTVIFAKTALHINEPYQLKESDFETQDDNRNSIKIDLGRYIFEVVSVLDHDDILIVPQIFRLRCPNSIRQSAKSDSGARVSYRIRTTGAVGPVTITSLPKSGSLFSVGKTTVNVTATDTATTVQCSFTVEVVLIESDEEDFTEIDDPSSEQSEEDILLRDLFEFEIPRDTNGRQQNRLKTVVVNRLALEYRLDNERSRTSEILDNSGRSVLNQPSYRDGTSKVIEIDIDRLRVPNEEEINAGQNERPLQPGDFVYITYVEVLKHYIRQRVDIDWGVLATPLPPSAFPQPSKIKVSNYRFFEWNLEKEDPNNEEEIPLRLGGWRVAETFHATPHHVSIVPGTDAEGNVLGDFSVAQKVGVQTFEYLPGTVSKSQLEDFVNEVVPFPTFQVNFNRRIQDASFHKNGAPLTYQQTDWFSRFEAQTRDEIIIEHLFYNVHEKSLKKRDIDKWAIDRFLAEEIEKDILAGKPTAFPFMDDPNIDNPNLPAPDQPIGVQETGNPTSGAREFLNATNLQFLPFQPVTRYSTANLDFTAGVGGSPSLGVNRPDDIFAQIVWGSNIIQEPFEEGTRVLVERHFTLAQRGDGIVAIEGVAGELLAKSVSCVLDPSHTYMFVFHPNSDSRLAFNFFRMDVIDDTLSKLEYRPEDESIGVILPNPRPEDFEDLIGFTGTIGDIPGYDEGKLVSPSSLIPRDGILFFTNDTESLVEAGVDSSRLIFLSSGAIEFNENTLTINLDELAFVGRTEIKYKFKQDVSQKDSSIMLFAKLGENRSGVVDLLDIQQPSEILLADNEQILAIDHRWFEADNIEIVGDRVNSEDLEILRVVVLKLDNDFASDFVKGRSSDTESRKPSDVTTTSPVFFETNITSVAEDTASKLFVFFNDTDDGISCAISDDFGYSWSYHYGIIEKMRNEESRDPFVINFSKGNKCFLLFRHREKILCKVIYFNKFQSEDTLLIERFEEDLLEINEGMTIERAGILSNEGRDLRSRTLSYVVAGDLTDAEFRDATQVEQRTVESKDDKDNVISKQRFMRISPLAIGSTTAFTNQPVTTSFFCGYRKDNGELRCIFLGETELGFELQCHYSVDDGINWFDLWEFKSAGLSRLKIDPDKQTQFIDRTENADNPDEEVIVNGSVLKEDLQESDQKYPFGINIHKKRETEEEGKEPSVEVTTIESPYVFYQSTTEKIFLFYIYENGLYCKIFGEDIFENDFTAIKRKIEDETKAVFLDGELFDTVVAQLELDVNFTFPYQHAIETFTEERQVQPQRVHACELSNGNVRVFYKNVKGKLRAVLFNGSNWLVEDFLRDPDRIGELPLADLRDTTT